MNNEIISAALREAREDLDFHRKRANLLEAKVGALKRKLVAAEALATAAKLSALDDINVLFVAADEVQRAGRMEVAIRLRQKARQEVEALRQWQEVSDA